MGEQDRRRDPADAVTLGAGRAGEEEFLASLPPEFPVSPERIAAAVAGSGRVLVVLDDDPTGTQSVAGLPVLTHWEEPDFDWAFEQGAPAIYVQTNARSLDPESARGVNREVVRAAVGAARRRGLSLGWVSRSDSTLRGHFPLEPDAIATALRELGESSPDGVILAPAFPDAGRVTVGGVHGMLAGGVFTPVGETEFARDSTFGYSASRLADWVRAKAGSAAVVIELSLETIRRGPEATTDVLLQAPAGAVIAVDALVEDDQRVLALSLEVVEAQGRQYIYRVGPPFVRARIGQRPAPPLTLADIDPGGTLPRTGGLVVVGSHVALTRRQLAHLIAQRPGATVVELSVPRILDPTCTAPALSEALHAVVDGLARGDVILYSSSDLIRTDDADESLAISRTVSDALVELVQRVLALRTLRFVVAKGGITSSDIGTKGLGIRRAVVRGPMLPGLISLWAVADGPARGLPFIVFAGNVGAEDSLTAVVRTLSVATP